MEQSQNARPDAHWEWREVVDALPFGVALLDESGVLQHANARLGVQAGGRALIGMRFDDVVACLSLARRGPFEGVVAGEGENPAVDVEFSRVVLAAQDWTLAVVRDASARRREERRFRLAFENNTSGMAIVNGDGTLLEVNRAYCDMLGYGAGEMIGHNVCEFTVEDDAELTLGMIKDIATGARTGASYVKRYRHRDGRVIYGELSVGGVHDDEGHIEGIVASVKDITDERALVAQLSHQALHDPLTGLANRALLQDRLSRAIETRARRGGTNALFLIDLDDFKGVNDTLGHHVGDELLVQISRRLESVTRAADTLCRFGGDEFLYLAENIESVEEIAQRLLSVFDEPFLAGSVSLEQSASLGVVLEDGPAEAHELMRNVDAAMYEAKRTQQRGYVVFTDAMRQRVSERYQLQRDLRRALALNEISLVYQPLVDLGTEEVVGFEALMRWEHPIFGAVSPEVFIGLAEQSELILSLGEYALQRACVAAAAWPANARGRVPHVSVNLSARQFHDPGLIDKVAHALTVSGLAPHRLVLEITESTTLTDLAGAAHLVEHLERLGVTIALDDFGTGYSSLTYLAHLKPLIIKIDRSFVHPIRSALSTNPLLESIVAFGHLLGLIMVAEGIEDEHQLEYLRHIGCDVGQGFHFSGPVDESEVAGVLRAVPAPVP